MANEKKIALVTGGNKGIGLEIVRNLTGAGCAVLLGARNAERGQEAVRQLEEKLARLGPVNMYALEEQQELEKRHSFLKVQSEDLESAR